MTESSEDLAAVEQLLAESDALRGWLARLDRAPGAAPDAVRERVRLDYQKRLDQVTAGLRAHAAVITAKLQDDRAELAGLQARATAARDALAEAELRHAVGEYNDHKFETERRRHASDIETFELSLAAVAERIGRLEEVHALVQGGPRALAIDVDARLTEVVATDGQPFTVDETDLVAIADLAPDGEDELAIFEEPAPEPAEPDRPAHPAAPVPETGPLSFRPSGSVSSPDVPRYPATPPARPRPFESAPPLGIPTADIPPRFVRPGERLGGPPAPPAAMPPAPDRASEPAGNSMAAAGPAAEASAIPVGRTLRCGECGAMNRPLEWYCEKCGAELTAV